VIPGIGSCKTEGGSSNGLRVSFSKEGGKSFAGAGCIFAFGFQPFGCDFERRAFDGRLFHPLPALFAFLQELFLQRRIFLDQFRFTHIHHRFQFVA
jgi:hypothetical protein